MPPRNETTDPPSPWTRATLASHLQTLGLEPGDAVLAHAALRSVGPILGGPDALIAALGDVLGPDGTLLGYCDWQLADEVRDDPALRDQIPPFDPLRSRSARDNGAFPELLRTTPGARRSGSPGASCAALGGRADWFTADHALDYGYGPQSPFGKLVASGGKTLMLGAPLDTMTLLHHAEHLADLPHKRVLHYEAPLLVDGRTVWRRFEEFDTSQPVVEGLAEDFFAEIVEAFLATGQGRRGRVGHAPSVLVEARPMVAFAVAWLESRFRGPR
ncbi:aminoglycoside 3-N-acetyltransferase [Corallococcus sp. ZKHCc1 1396]|uniref:Aminoglycoside N(3)-acetyltransferase n=2 Tax=Corallococcus soli TaxID=2710757 RepID=A0ABR9PMF5_9BACT|nr:aminoglycoside 3-N-acetyltransferase [Corallococcus soli]MBE4749111.1 aminoglycoside 3-N-acetyltransferase [Corallococcus soli]